MIKKILISYLKYIGAQAGKKREKEVRILLPKQENAKYLDLGCEDGKLTAQRAGTIETKNIYGVEILESEIEKAKKLGINVKNADLNKKIPYDANCFDVVTATQVIEHLYNVDSFVSEVHRVLKKGGIFIISTENLAAWHNVVALVLGLQPSTGPFISTKFSLGFHPLNKEHVKDYEKNPHLAYMNGHTRVMAYNSFKKLFEEYGFKMISEKTLGYYPFPGILADMFSSIDRWHALDMILKLKKI